MSRTPSALSILVTLLLTGCDSGKPQVVVGSKEPEYSENSEWSKARQRAGSVRASDWKTRYNQYSQSLIAQAALAGLDSFSLSNALQVILEDAPRKERAYVPFAAYGVEVDHEPVWEVHLAWEFDGGDLPLLHHCCYSISAQNFREVAFVTCR